MELIKKALSGTSPEIIIKRNGESILFNDLEKMFEKDLMDCEILLKGESLSRSKRCLCSNMLSPKKEVIGYTWRDLCFLPNFKSTTPALKCLEGVYEFFECCEKQGLVTKEYKSF